MNTDHLIDEICFALAPEWFAPGFIEDLSDKDLIKKSGELRRTVRIKAKNVALMISQKIIYPYKNKIADLEAELAAIKASKLQDGGG